MLDNIFDTGLETERLILRKLRIADDIDMFEYTSNNQITKYLEWEPHTSISQTQDFIGSALNAYNQINNAFLWGIEEKKDKKLIGVVRVFDFSKKNSRAEISYILNPFYQGKGYMVESIKTVLKFCFHELKINRIQAKCTSDNIASEWIMKKTGMKNEGLLKEFFRINGEKKDALIYSILVSEFAIKE